MFYIIETEEQLNVFNNHRFDEVFVHLIPLNNNKHPRISDISLIYIKPLTSHKGYLMCINTNESFSLKLGQVTNVLSRIDKIYVVDKKDALYHLPFESQLFDIKLTQNVELPFIPLIGLFYNHFPEKSDINKLIPIPKHYEYCEMLFNSIDFEIVKGMDDWYKFYNDYLIPTFYLVENQGLMADVDLLKDYFTLDDPSYSILGNKVFSKYNLYNNTSRPSNSFNNINFGALNKSDGCRNAFIPENDILIEMDFDSFHVRLLGDIIGYEFGDENIHTYLGRLYFDTTELTKEQYKESKGITFKILYTSTKIEDYQHIEFFKLVKEYKEGKWKEYNKNGHIYNILSKKPISNVKSKTQLLPYILQNYETELNVIKMYKILRLLADKKTKLILYNYDAIVLDFNKIDGKQLLIDIQTIMEEGGYPIKVKMGDTYAFN